MESPPIKPPRGVKATKETSGLLMSVIRSLSATETNEQRDREKAKLESDYKQCDKRLDDLVQHHEEDLTQVMSIFTKLTHEVSESRSKIHRIKDSLKECKNTLYGKRNELEKLWIKGQEYKYMLQFLDEIEKLREVPTKVQSHLNKKEYLHATDLLLEAISSKKDGLEDIAGIKELCMEIEQKKEELHVTLLSELKQQIYVKTSQHVFTLSRQNSGREGFANTPLRRSNKFRMSSKRNISRQLFDDSITKAEKRSKSFDVEEDLYVLNQESDPNHFVAILVKCLAQLGKIPYAVNLIKMHIREELLHIVQRTTLFINDFINLQGNDKQETKNVLLEFMHTLFEQFKQVAQAHNVLLNYLSQAVAAHKIDVALYDMKLYWTQVQFIIQNLLQDYLDMQNVVNEPQTTKTFTDDDDLSVFFYRKKQPVKKETLFKFGDSSSAMIMSSTIKDDDQSKLHKVLVCEPSMDNILFIFVPLMCFIEEIEEAMGLQHGVQCTLHQFLSGYTTNTFLKRKAAVARAEIDNAIQAKDAWKETVLLDVSTDYKPLLVSSVSIEKTIRRWLDILEALPMYGEHIVRYSSEALREYRDTCQGAYNAIVQPHTEDRRICSAAWLKDDDISRFLKCLPNWVNLKAQQETQARNERRRVIRRELTIEEESPEDIRQRNRKEAEILAGNLGEGGVDAREILSDMSLLKQLAQLQESMEWFSVRMLQFASEFRQDPTNSPAGLHVEAISPTALQHLTSLAQDFDELANTCLLLLHLEVRVQCFHYLLAVNDFNKDTHEPDPKVLELIKVLSNVDEAMTSSLHPRKCKYIFEGLGHLIAKILISSTQGMQIIDDQGIEGMCRNVFALQQMLTNITMTREVALDHARHYFELFFSTPEEILNGIVEKGPEFSELEYMNAFQLLNRSRNGTLGPINIHLERLSDILGEVGVTV